MALVDVFWLDIELLVLGHEIVTLAPKWTAFFRKVAAEFDEIEDVYMCSTAHSDEIKHELSHIGLFLLALVSLAPFSGGIVLVVRDELFLGPEDEESTEKLEEVKHVCERCMVRNVHEEHFCEEIVLDAEHFGQLGLH